MKNIYYKRFHLIIVSIVIVFTISGNSQTYVTGGDVSGTWISGGSPYYIQGEISIPNGETLIIEPGVSVIFMGHYKFNVQGGLVAIGTQQDSIHFTADDTQIGWHGIRFNYTPATNDTSKIIYCSFRYGKANTGSYTGSDRCGGAIFVKGFSKVLILNSLFEKNMNDGEIAAATGGAAIYVGYTNSIIISNNTFLNNVGTTDCSILSWRTNSVITNNSFLNNSGPHGPVFCAYLISIISGNIFAHNVTTRAGGAIFNMTSKDTITNNIIINNSCFGGEGEGGGIKCWINDSSIIINNTIAYNSSAHGGGVCCNDHSGPIFINNIIWGNTSPDGAQVNLVDTHSDPDFLYCDIEGRKEAFGGNGSGVNYTGIYENNIDLDPLFIDTTLVDYRLSNLSHCIGAGWDTVEVHEVNYGAPPFDIFGNPRPNPVGTRPDIGACESSLGVIGGVQDEIIPPKEFSLKQNYPNPFNPTTKIEFRIQKTGFVSLKVCGVLGKEVATLVNEEKTVGNYELDFDGTGLPSGIYFYQLKTGNFIDTKKMVLLK